MKKLLMLAIALLVAGPALAVPMGDDGLYKPDWFQNTFKDLPDDFAQAQSEGRRVVLMIEQRGCIYCKKMHEQTFTDPRIKKLLENNYFAIQINLHGDTQITDTDGKALSEKQAARRWGVLFTPTMIFLPDKLDPTKTAAQQAVAVMPGAFGRGTTLDLLNWVYQKLYLTKTGADFQSYHSQMILKRNDGDTR